MIVLQYWHPLVWGCYVRDRGHSPDRRPDDTLPLPVLTPEGVWHAVLVRDSLLAWLGAR